MAKWVYMFTEGNAGMRNLLGGKGANLAEMTSLGLPVPQGFTITTEACTQYYEDGRMINDEIMDYDSHFQNGRNYGKEIRRQRESASCFCSFRCKGVDAGHDGHDSESWFE